MHKDERLLIIWTKIPEKISLYFKNLKINHITCDGTTF